MHQAAEALFTSKPQVTERVFRIVEPGKFARHITRNLSMR
jgi:hypothetical protein